MAREPHQKANYEYMEVELNNTDGSEEYVRFKPRAFNIVWGNDKRCWRMAAKPIGSSTSRFSFFIYYRKNEEEFAELLQVSWLEVTGVTSPLSGGSTYRITFRLSLEKGASGWTGSPVFLMAKVGKKGKYKWKRLEMEKLTTNPQDLPSEADPLDVEIAAADKDKRLYFGMYEVWSGKWKQGLKVYKATVKQIKK
ncbi:protein PHLOEM PROTEIN 2-LIKE A9-like isoform X1 [Gossypium australe]|uniref:Protein PHLOEM PROTEIN 2-LIKE A9-like isoform X1 n=1 Tax=Gossypium australe TaxID=47621 RepID=A0A5B6UFE4_9ROSI|nr:protein PHLOEM PROTEIN 2-LIKE A9-like isoform X1 [Gossypium australe]